MRTYTFTAECKSGIVKTFTFDAAGYLAARQQLNTLIDAN